MSDFPAYRLHDALGYQLSVTARSHERRMDDGLRALGLTRVSWCVLLAVGNEKFSRPSEIAKFIGIDRTATSRALRQMDNAGLVARENGKTDRRTKRVRLTEAGIEMLRRSTPLAIESAALMAQRLDETEQRQLSHLLAKARADDALPLTRF